MGRLAVAVIRECPIFIRPHSKTVFSRSIHNDTEFLSRQMVMDYSLLVGIDEARGELVLGVIGESAQPGVCSPVTLNKSLDEAPYTPPARIVVSSRACWGELPNGGSGESVQRTVQQSINKSSNRSIYQSSNRWMNRESKEATDRAINPAIDRLID